MNDMVQRMNLPDDIIDEILITSGWSVDAGKVNDKVFSLYSKQFDNILFGLDFPVVRRILNDVATIAVEFYTSQIPEDELPVDGCMAILGVDGDVFIKVFETLVRKYFNDNIDDCLKHEDEYKHLVMADVENVIMMEKPGARYATDWIMAINTDIEIIHPENN